MLDQKQRWFRQVVCSDTVFWNVYKNNTGSKAYAWYLNDWWLNLLRNWLVSETRKPGDQNGRSIVAQKSVTATSTKWIVSNASFGKNMKIQSQDLSRIW